MFGYRVTLIYKNFCKFRIINTINITSLGVGLSVVSLIALIYTHQSNYDKFHVKSDRLYIIQESVNDQSPYFTTPTAVLPALLKDITTIESGTRLLFTSPSWIEAGKTEVKEPVAYADSSFFTVFTFPLKFSNGPKPLGNVNSVVLSQELSAKLFNDENPVGKSITIDSKPFIVSGVIKKIPTNSSIRPSVVLPISNYPGDLNDWKSSTCPTYVVLRDQISTSTDKPILQAELSSFTKLHYSQKEKKKIELLRFSDYFKTSAGQLYSFTLLGLLLIGIMVTLLVSLNFINLSLLASSLRFHEFAIRKSVGSSEVQLRYLLLWESLTYVFISIILGVFLLYFSLPGFNQFFETEFEFNASTSKAWLILNLTIAIFICTLVSVYPVRAVSGNKLSHLLRGKALRLPGLQVVRTVTVSVQYLISCVLTASTLVIILQSSFLKGINPGFVQDHIVVADLSLDYDNKFIGYARVNTILNEIKNYAGVRAISTSSFVPGRFVDNYLIMTDRNNEEFLIRNATVDTEYFNLFNIKILDGRAFSKDVKSDSSDAIILNKKAIQLLGLSNPIGKSVYFKGGTKAFYIVGVTDDYHFRGLNKDVEPLVHFCGGTPRMSDNAYLSIRVEPGSGSTIAKAIQDKFNLLVTKKKITLKDFKDEFGKQYYVINKTSVFLSFVALITIIIACTGIFGLSSFVIQQSMKQIGIRKVLGAGVVDIIINLTKRLFIITTVCSVCASPLTYLLMNAWLSSFPLKISYPWWVSLVSGVLVTLVTFFTVIGLTYRASLVNPVITIRS